MKRKLTVMVAMMMCFVFVLTGCGNGSTATGDANNGKEDFSVGKNEIKLSNLCKNNIIFRLTDDKINGKDADTKITLSYFDDNYLYKARDVVEYNKFWNTSYDTLVNLCKEKCKFKPDSIRVTEPVHGYVIPKCVTVKTDANTNDEIYYYEYLKSDKIDGGKAYFENGSDSFVLAHVNKTKLEVEHVNVNGLNIMKTKDYSNDNSYLCVIDTDETKDITAIVLDEPESKTE